jgi:hypothetical protein
MGMQNTATATRPSRRAIRTGHLTARDVQTMRRLFAAGGRLAAIAWTRKALRAIANARAASEGDYRVAVDLVNLHC